MGSVGRSGMATRSATLNVMSQAANKAARGLKRDFGERVAQQMVPLDRTLLILGPGGSSVGEPSRALETQNFLTGRALIGWNEIE